MTTGAELAEAFVAAWTARPPDDPRGLAAAIAEPLVALCAAARAQLAEHAIEERPADAASAELALVGALAARAPGRDLADYLARSHIGDLALAQAASRGNEAAIAAIERAHRAVIDGVCWRYAGPGHTKADLEQILRERLYVAAPGARPRIADYAGQGPLASWLRITAVRVFLDLTRRKDRAREAPATDGELAMPDPRDLSLEIIKAEYRAAVGQAMRDATTQLELADRHLLHQHFVAGLTIDQLGVALGIHRATAARRVVKAREALVAHTKTLLTERLRLEGAELDEVIDLALSRLDVSIPRLLDARARDAAR